MTRSGSPRVAVVGAGAFGGWTALHLLRRGAGVTLLDAWGAGNARSSSGGDSRVIRAMYGPDSVYVNWILRAFELWEQAERRWETPLYTRTGALWMFRGDDRYARASLPLLRERGLEVEELTAGEAASRFPMIELGGVQSVFLESEAGVLAARTACRRLLEAFVSGGGRFRRARAGSGELRGGCLERIPLSDGSSVEADRFVFACGPWSGELFPALLGSRLEPTRQEVYYFGTPAGSDDFSSGRLPVWIDFGERVYYGVPDLEGGGFKIADDTHGERVDPSTLERVLDPAGVERARALLAERFPVLADAPLVASRVCQYTCAPDGHYVLDRHPEVENLWIATGGSGHGFKLGPAVGEHVADLVTGRSEPVPRFSISRLAEAGAHRSQFEAGAGSGS